MAKEQNRTKFCDVPVPTRLLRTLSDVFYLLLFSFYFVIRVY